VLFFRKFFKSSIPRARRRFLYSSLSRRETLPLLIKEKEAGIWMFLNIFD
jgi:hypothetical protein